MAGSDSLAGVLVWSQSGVNLAKPSSKSSKISGKRKKQLPSCGPAVWLPAQTMDNAAGIRQLLSFAFP